MRLFRSMKQYYMNLKLQNKLTLLLLLIIFVPALFTIGFFNTRLYKLAVSDTLQTEQTALAAVVPQLNAILESVKNTSQELTNLSFYRDLFFAPVEAPISTLLDSDKAAGFLLELEKLLSTSPVDHVRIYLDVPENELFSSHTNPEIASVFGTVKGRRSYWRGIFSGTGTKTLYCPPFYTGEHEKQAYGDEAYIRATTIYYNEAPVTAYIACYYSSSVYTDILKENLALEGSVSYIINDRDSIVASTDESLTGIFLLSYDTIESSYIFSNTFISRTILEKDVYAAFYSIGEPHWFLVMVLPKAPMILQAALSLIKLIFIYLSLLILAFIFAAFLSRSITGRISKVIESMNSVREGPPVPINDPTAHDEIGDLIDTYNYMTGQMNQLLEKQARDAEDLRIAEFNSLQAQINPHFLYNTMDMIHWMAVQGRTAEISNAVQKLSRFYRLTLSRKSTISTIAEETEHAAIYTELQNMRYHNSITFIADIPDELNEYHIPMLTMQPVIENAIQHGILEKESRTGTIVLTGWMEEEDIVILVSDDGIGIPPDILSSICTGNGKKRNSNGNNIAIYNTHRRLQLLYGNHYGLHYSSTVGTGTEVEIRIPAR